jgi:hypothetical protein
MFKSISGKYCVMSELKKLEIIYHNGQPNGLRTCRLASPPPVVTAHVVPRTLLTEAKKITSITNPGIYFLINDNLTEIYVGQTQNGIARLTDHNIKKDFWTTAILFLSITKHFNLDTISGLEVYAITKTKENNKFAVHNTVDPKYKIDEYDLPGIKKIYAEIEFIMTTLGYSLSQQTKTGTHNYENGGEVFKTSRRDVVGLGIYTEKGFTLLPGSQIDFTHDSNLATHNTQRQDLLKARDITKNAEGKYILNTTVEFTTPSGAGAFVLGGSINGWTEWKNSDGKTLDDSVRKKQK